MLPVCAATTGYSSHSQISLHVGLLPFSSQRRSLETKCIVEHKVISDLSTGFNHQRVSFKSKAATSFYSNIVENAQHSDSVDFIDLSIHQNELDNIKSGFQDNGSYSFGGINEPSTVGIADLKFGESSSLNAGEEELMDFTDGLIQNTNIVPKPTNPQTMTTFGVLPKDAKLVSESLNMDPDSLSSVKISLGDTFAGVNEYIRASVSKGENAVKNSIDTISSSTTSAFKSVDEVLDNVVSKVTSAVNQMRNLADDRLTDFSDDLNKGLSKAGIVAVDVLRRSIVAVEDSVAQGVNFVVYVYGSIKESFPSEVQSLLNTFEERAVKISRPVGTTIQQVSVALEGLERSLGLDPNDPVVPFVLFLGTSAILCGSYWVLTYGGYAGDLSPESTLELLKGEESVVLIDVRPEDLRKRDGVPDLRRVARFRYANVTLPEVDDSVRKLLRSGRELEETLIAAVTRNLKIVQDRSKVIVMDADGSHSKGIARSLSRLGVKKPYLVQGGFQSWIKQGLRIKELKPETALTIFNEDAEAILEDISPTPLQVLGYGVGVIAVAYALLEWEKTLQLIGIVGLGQTIYRRVASYEDSEDFKEDLRLLVAPFRLGGQAISWAAGKLETNRIGLPTSPSSSDVQSRVLQAAAKLESQPSDSDELQDPSPQLTAAVNEKVDLSEA